VDFANKRKIAIAGAGPAGIMAAITSAARGLETTVFERNRAPGKKLLITGKGRCNFTNSADTKQLIDNIPGNGSFLFSAFNSYGSSEIVNFFESNGVAIAVERGGRIFPASGEASDILKALVDAALQLNVNFLFNSRVKSAIVEKGAISSVILENDLEVGCDALIIAVGGLSYPSTGSTGDGYEIASHLGHSIVDGRPALVPLIVEEHWARDLQGLSLRNISVRFLDPVGRIIYKDFGEMLFTHFGISGPVILSGSIHLARCGFKGSAVFIDLKPALSEDRLDARLQRDFVEFSRKIFINSLDELLPQSMIPVIVKLSGIDPEKPVNQITKDERLNLGYLLKNLKLNITGSRGFDEAIITSGGVSVKEINPRSMESKIVKGLYFAGEVIDVDGYSGGYNLSVAFSTGHAAGSSC